MLKKKRILMAKNSFYYDDKESLDQYFKEIRKSTPITQEEEVILAKKIKEGDAEAINTLVNSNLKFVISIAKEYQNQGLSLSDLISEGNYGLINAAHRFDYTKGFKFISYAVWWIRQSIIKSLNENARLIRLPVNVISKLNFLKKEIERFELENEREPVFSEISDNDSFESLTTMKFSSLNEPINEDGDEIGETLSSGDTSDSGLMINNKIKSQLEKTLSVLDERERHIVECYFGINKEHESMTLEAIGEKYSLTKERIRQIKERAIRKLRHNASELYTLMNE